jgi:hypothetical protein
MLDVKRTAIVKDINHQLARAAVRKATADLQYRRAVDRHEKAQANYFGSATDRLFHGIECLVGGEHGKLPLYDAENRIEAMVRDCEGENPFDDKMPNDEVIDCVVRYLMWQAEYYYKGTSAIVENPNDYE